MPKRTKSTQKKCLTLYIPDLFSALRRETADLTYQHLAQLLSKAHIQPCLTGDGLTFLSSQCAVSEHKLSRAALALHGAGKATDSWVCYATPVQMQANRDHLTIVQASDFDFDEGEGAAMCAEFNAHFSADKIHFVYHHPGLFFCFSHKSVDVAACSPKDIIGHNLANHMPSGKGEMQVRQWFNESQMLLHHSLSNRQRMINGKAEINSLWFWGGGGLPEKFTLAYVQVFTNISEVAGFARLGRARFDSLPSNLNAEHFTRDGNHFIYYEALETPEALSLTDSYASRCLSLLKNKTIDEFRLIPEYGKQFILTSRSLNKFWKATKPIDSFICKP